MSLILALGFAFVSPIAALAHESITFERRVEAQRAIEEVAWRHRVWPAGNSGPKPSLDRLMPPAAIRAKVQKALAQSDAIEQLFGRPLTAAMLQAEIERMARDTLDPGMLGELFAALGDDPGLVAECLARPLLAGRLAVNWANWPIAGNTAPEATGAPTDAAYTLPKIAATSDSSGCVPGTWLPLPSDAPEARSRHTAVWTGSEMIVWGGADADGNALDTGGRYDPATDTWLATSTAPGVPAARDTHSAVWTGTRMIVWGGQSSGSRLNSGGSYDPANDTWTATSTGAGVPSVRDSHTAVWTGSEMIVWGGRFATPLATGGRYDPAADSWTATSTGLDTPDPRYQHTAVWTGSEMIVWGGASYATFFGTGSRYDPASNSWKAMLPGPDTPAARTRHTATWTGSEMIVWGGFNLDGTGANHYESTGARYSAASDAWSPVSQGIGSPAGRSDHLAIWTGTRMVVWGGWAQASLGSGGLYDPWNDSWTPAGGGTAAPESRWLSTVVWTGFEMIVWGGQFLDVTGSHLQRSGGRYDPGLDSWVPTPDQMSVPAGRERATAVWTGAEMIVWGGYFVDPHGYNYENTGGRFDPATAAWTPTSTGSGAPLYRTRHTAVWTGSEMIVWGGDFGGAPLGSGGRYDPAQDAWTPTSEGASAPLARSDHSAVWTGDRMIVWGGVASYSYLDTGGIYDPAQDAWIPTPVGGGTPEARAVHTAVWTGTEMILWGGSGLSGPLATGGRYHPWTGTWSGVSSGSAAPGRRTNHTAVWTGAEMIVWGGEDTGGAGPVDLDTGGRYRPVTDSWAATSLAVMTPSPRCEHTAIWAGGKMIVWGGRSNMLPVAAGGSYDPAADNWLAAASPGFVPAARYRHSALWTGSEMILWGGQGAGSRFLGTGGRTCTEPCVSANWYADPDHDDLGAATAPISSCAQPPGYVATPGDNCPADYNPDQADSDLDGTGDACQQAATFSVTITSPTPDPVFETTSSMLVIGGTASGGTIKVAWSMDSGGHGACKGTTLWTAKVPLEPGVNRITLLATGKSGEQATDSIMVTLLDATAPTIKIKTPTERAAFTTRKSSITLAGKAKDNFGISTITWKNLATGQEGAAGTGKSWRAGPIPLVPGDNAIEVTARDASGNEASDSVMVTFRP